MTVETAKMFEETFRRDMTLDLRAIDQEARTVPASLSSEIEVERTFGFERVTEVLVHTPAAINLERAGEGLPLLWGHDQDRPIGLVEGVRVEDGRLRGLLRFSSNPKAKEVWQDVREGFLKNISIGYRINKWEESGETDHIRVVRWTPLEASVLSVPADHTVGINRSESEDTTMADTTEKKPAKVPESATRADAATAPV
ncbi:MAG: HK97 family phage prohead protease, partial [Rhodospirillales bacterium]|nr:HK97 family phage prohead protease [Rhodospirillales bacterium]